MPTPVSPDLLRSLPAGTSVTLTCCTTDADIYYHGPAERDRKRVTPTHYQLHPVHYEVSGTVEGVEEGEFSYLVLSTKSGECVVMGTGQKTNRIIGHTIKFKVRHVPLSAVVRVKRD